LNIVSGASILGNRAYNPSYIAAMNGDIIRVSNNDNSIHTVTNGHGPEDPNSGKLFDTSLISPGNLAEIQTSSLAMGKYPYYCTVHPYMNGILTIN
jgi:cytochrome c oxidase subunit II